MVKSPQFLVFDAEHITRAHRSENRDHRADSDSVEMSAILGICSLLCRTTRRIDDDITDPGVYTRPSLLYITSMALEAMQSECGKEPRNAH
jgi:hypothetical protein